jgi:nitroreductase
MTTWILTDTQFAAAVATAVRAPSIHNSQPWRFQLATDGIDLRLDPDRVLPVADPTGRAARISCGAALYNLRLALAVRGTPAQVTLRPDPHDHHLLARLTPAAPRPATPQETRLHAAIAHRHTNRDPYADTAVEAVVQNQLATAARTEGAGLLLITTPVGVETIAAIVRSADETLNRDEAYLAELRAWTRTNQDAADGVPTTAGGPAPNPDQLLARRDFGGAESHREFERDPLLGVLCSHGDHPADDLTAGMALQRVLLTATDLGLACSMFTQPTDVPAMREQLRAALGRHDNPQVLLRFGYAVRPVPTGRRPATDVITPT